MTKKVTIADLQREIVGLKALHEGKKDLLEKAKQENQVLQQQLQDQRNSMQTLCDQLKDWLTIDKGQIDVNSPKDDDTLEPVYFVRPATITYHPCTLAHIQRHLL